MIAFYRDRCSQSFLCENVCPDDAISREGFRVDEVSTITDIVARCYQCTHLATDARIMHLHCNDEENLYSVTFRTPPADATGVAHILEHCVLAGSCKYPVKDAFNELLKSSLQTRFQVILLVLPVISTRVLPMLMGIPSPPPTTVKMK